MTDDVVVIDSLVKCYSGVSALDNVSLSVRRGEFIALLGPSGCGKTTLLRCTAGFILPTSGDIRINGHSMNGVPPNRRPVNTVFQQYALFPHMTVRQNIEFGPRRRRMAAGERARVVEQALSMMSLDGLDGRYPRELSGGQQQRVALARAIVNRPEVLLLDEPLGALDLKLRTRMQLELKRLHQQLGTTFLFVTHDQQEALTMADRIAVMRDGVIVQLDTAQEIYRNPVSRYVADFVGEANLIETQPASGERLDLPGTVEGAYLAPGGKNVAVMVRPEEIRIGEAQPGSHSVSLTATLVDKVFAGSSWRLVLRLADGQEVTAEPGHGPDVEHLAAGSETLIWWRKDAARLLAQ